MTLLFVRKGAKIESIEQPGDPSKVIGKTATNASGATKVIIKKEKGKKKDLKSKLNKFLAAKVISKELSKGKVSVDVNAIVSQPVYSKDKDRFFNRTFEVEKRSLFFE